METSTRIMATDVHLSAKPPLVPVMHPSGDFSISIGYILTLYFDHKEDFKAFVGKLMEEAAKL